MQHFLPPLHRCWCLWNWVGFSGHDVQKHSKIMFHDSATSEFSALPKMSYFYSLLFQASTSWASAGWKVQVVETVDRWPTHEMRSSARPWMGLLKMLARQNKSLWYGTWEVLPSIVLFDKSASIHAWFYVHALLYLTTTTTTNKWSCIGHDAFCVQRLCILLQILPSLLWNFLSLAS